MASTPRPALNRAAAPDPDFEAMLSEVFTDYRASRPARLSGEVDLDRDLWRQLESLGLTRLTGSPDEGGSGADWLASAALLRHAAGAAAPVPLVEHDLLGGWLAEQAGLPAGSGIRAVCRPDPSGRAVNVVWGREADSVVALWEIDDDEWFVADVPIAKVRITKNRNIAGVPSDTLNFSLSDLDAGAPVEPHVGYQFHQRGSLARSVQTCGAMGRVLDLVVAHAQERHQFGRPIGRFQSVAHLIADLAAEISLAQVATDAAVARAAASDWSQQDTRALLFDVGVAKSTTGHAASRVVRGAHQVLGAMGTTLEHELGSLTRPILAWRSEYGSIHEWDETLTNLATSAGRDRLWSIMTRPVPGRRADSAPDRDPFGTASDGDNDD